MDNLRYGGRDEAIAFEHILGTWQQVFEKMFLVYGSHNILLRHTVSIEGDDDEVTLQKKHFWFDVASQCNLCFY